MKNDVPPVTGREWRECNACHNHYQHGCTNGRCLRCHNAGYCTDGGDTSPGHYPTTPKKETK